MTTTSGHNTQVLVWYEFCTINNKRSMNLPRSTGKRKDCCAILRAKTFCASKVKPDNTLYKRYRNTTCDGKTHQNDSVVHKRRTRTIKSLNMNINSTNLLTFKNCLSTIKFYPPLFLILIVCIQLRNWTYVSPEVLWYFDRIN